MGKGIDVGTMNICAEKERDSTVFAQERNAFLEVDANDLTKNMLDSANVLYVEKGDKFHILDDDAFKFANVFKRNIRREILEGQ